MVCPYDLTVPGGVQAQVDGLAGALDKLGVTVTVIAPSTTGGASGHASYAFAGVGRSVGFRANGSTAPVAPGPIAMTRTLRSLRAVRADVVHVHEPLTPGSSLAALLAGPRPIVATFHRSGSDRTYRAEGKLLRGLVRRIDAPVAVSEAARATAEEVLGKPLGPMEVIPNGVSIDTTERQGDEQRGEIVLAFVGRHEERKGLAVLLAAWQQLDSLHGGVPLRLRIIGNGPDTPALRRQYGGVGSIEWLGAVDDSAKRQVLREADIFVAPSIRGESFGVVLLEAMAAGAPVVASDLAGYKLAAADAALYFTAGDSAALADKLTALIRDEDRLLALGRAGSERAQLFSLDKIAARYMELYESVAANRR
jgi:phosphatidyl-myo-inositol alpha-mannosyltransferase